MKKITSISAQTAPEGIRVGYTYSEIDDNGEITSRHNAGGFLAGAEEQAAVQVLMDAAQKRVDNA